MDEHDEHDGFVADKAFTILHDGPPALGKGHHSKGKKASQGPTAEELARQRLLAAHPALYQGEPEEFRLRRADACTACWDALSARIQATLEGADRDVFGSLLEFVKNRHRAPVAGTGEGLVGDGYRRVPTALVLAGGVNSADHALTFPSLAQHLRDQGLYVALLQPGSFGRSVGEVLNEVLRQLSGLDTQAQHAEALLAWYQDEVGDGPLPDSGAAAEEPSGQGAAEGQGRPDQQQEQREQHQPEVEGQEGEQQGGEGGGGRQLRQRPAPAAAAAAAARAAAAAERWRTNRGRPLVVIVEGTEALDPGCLRDVLLTFSENHARLPVNVMLGLTTSESVLGEMLSSEVTDRCMDCRSFKLASAMQRMERLVSEVLLGGAGGWPGLLFDAGVVGTLVEKFFSHYYSTGILRQGLQLAALEHFRAEPASFLAPAALAGTDALRAACKGLPGPVAAQVKACSGARSGALVADAFAEAMDGWRRWAVALQWIVAAANKAGLSGKGSCLRQYYSVLLDGLDPKFATTGTAKQLGELEQRLRRLQPEQVCQLAGELEALAGRVTGAGSQALAAELEQLRQIAAEAAQPPHEQLQEQAQEAGAAAFIPGDASQEGAAEARPRPELKAKPASKKRDRFHSKTSRLQGLLENTAKATAASKGSTAAAAAKRAREAAAPGAKLGAWLGGAVRGMLATPPGKLPGAAMFTCKASGALECLSAAPRQVVHTALTQPDLFLKGAKGQVGYDAGMEDACLAYTLFDQDPNCVNVADWFQAFSDVHDKKGKKAAVKRKGRAAEGEGTGSGEDAQRERLRELAARFSQGTGELQLVGLIKPARRRRGDFVQRLVHMPGAEPE